MKYFLLLILAALILGYFITNKQQSKMAQNDIKNEKLKNYSFLEGMYQDSYFPDFLVDKGRAILIELCIQIEEKKPKNLPELYELTHAATQKFNDLDEEFGENDSEIETAGAVLIANDFEFIANAYGFDADIEALIATRYW
ncbi:MAG: hypothetical protein RIR11_1814 [Bacteroidota bacterium]|jgi:hypothetical protein